MYRFGNGPGNASCRQAPLTSVEIPRAKPSTLQGPHHADQATSFWLATAVVERPAPLLNTGTHSAPDRIAKPRGLSQMYWPPATQWSPLTVSASKGAMKRGLGSCGSTSNTLRTVPSDRPQLSVSSMARKTYSASIRQPLSGSTRVSPPSPPKGDPILPLPARSSGSRSDPPLSWRPPDTATPPGTRPTATE